MPRVTDKLNFDGKKRGKERNTIKIDSINAGMPPEVVPIKRNSKPTFTTGAIENSLDISYDGIPQHYGVWWSANSKFIRHYAVDNFDNTLLGILGLLV